MDDMPPPPGRSSHRVRGKDVGAPPRCANTRKPGALQQARGRMESHWRLLLHAAPDVAVDRAANPSAAVPSNRQEGGDQGGSAQAELPLAEAAPPRQSRTVLQPLHWGDCRPGAAKAPAIPGRPPRRRHQARTFSSSSPSTEAHPVSTNPGSALAHASGLVASPLSSILSEHSRRGGGAAKPPTTEPSGGHGRRGTDVEQGREMGRDRAVPSKGCLSGFDPGSALDYEVTLGQFPPLLGPRFPSVKSRQQ